MNKEDIRKVVLLKQNFPGKIASPSSVGISTNGKLYAYDGMMGKRRYGSDEHSMRLWNKLQALLIRYGVDSWNEEYDDITISDGYGWTLMLSLADGSVRKHVGINAKPVGLTSIETTFEAVVSAIMYGPNKAS